MADIERNLTHKIELKRPNADERFRIIDAASKNPSIEIIVIWKERGTNNMLGERFKPYNLVSAGQNRELGILFERMKAAQKVIVKGNV